MKPQLYLNDYVDEDAGYEYYGEDAELHHIDGTKIGNTYLIRTADAAAAEMLDTFVSGRIKKEATKE